MRPPALGPVPDNPLAAEWGCTPTTAPIMCGDIDVADPRADLLPPRRCHRSGVNAERQPVARAFDRFQHAIEFIGAVNASRADRDRILPRSIDRRSTARRCAVRRITVGATPAKCTRASCFIRAMWVSSRRFARYRSPARHGSRDRAVADFEFACRAGDYFDHAVVDVVLNKQQT